MIVFKAVKPTKLKQEAFRIAFLSMMHKAERDIKKDFQATVATWEHKVEFESMVSLSGGGPTVVVGTNDQIYSYVNNGTPEHDIPVSDPDGQIMYEIGFTPKTVPGVIGSGQGGKFGPKHKHGQMVHHPGIVEPRKFDEAIQEKWQPIFQTRAEQAMKEGAKNSGHGITKG